MLDITRPTTLLTTMTTTTWWNAQYIWKFWKCSTVISTNPSSPKNDVLVSSQICSSSFYAHYTSVTLFPKSCQILSSRCWEKRMPLSSFLGSLLKLVQSHQSCDYRTEPWAYKSLSELFFHVSSAFDDRNWLIISSSTLDLKLRRHKFKNTSSSCSHNLLLPITE